MVARDLREALHAFLGKSRRHLTLAARAVERELEILWSGHPEARASYPFLFGCFLVGGLLLVAAWLDPFVPAAATILATAFMLLCPPVAILDWYATEYAVFRDGFWIRKDYSARGIQEYLFADFDVIEVRHRALESFLGVADVEFRTTPKGGEAPAFVVLRGLEAAQAERIVLLAAAHLDARDITDLSGEGRG